MDLLFQMANGHRNKDITFEANQASFHLSIASELVGGKGQFLLTSDK